MTFHAECERCGREETAKNLDQADVEDWQFTLSSDDACLCPECVDLRQRERSNRSLGEWCA